MSFSEVIFAWLKLYFRILLSFFYVQAIAITFFLVLTLEYLATSTFVNGWSYSVPLIVSNFPETKIKPYSDFSVLNFVSSDKYSPFQV